jgi:serine/threonine protein kinase
LALGTGTAREIDVIIIGARRIFVVDIKDLHGRIESADGGWTVGGKHLGSSPVAKVNDVARNIYILLKSAMAKRPETRTLLVPKVDGLVVLTGNADRSGIAETEAAKVLTLNEFVASVGSAKAEQRAYGNVAGQFLSQPLTDPFWKDRLTRFFNAGLASPFKPGRRRFQRYMAQEAASYEHPKDIYREYEAQEDGTPPSLGTLRLWNFSKVADARFQTEAGRREIAGRERQVYNWLRDRSEDVERNLLTPRIDDPELGTHYWEIYDRRRRLKRLADFASTEASQLSGNELVELARQILAAVAELHQHTASHLDLGAHSIWLEAPTTVRLSHLFPARFSEIKSLGPSRYHFLASVKVPEDVLGNDGGPQRRDVFLAGVAIHQLLFGDIPGGDPPEWNPTADKDGRFAKLHDWFSEALDLEPKNRFADARVALEAFNKVTAERPTPEEVTSGLDRFRGAIRSQLTLLNAYPIAQPAIKESDSVDAWRSTHEGTPVVVKMWKQGAWGDLRKEGARILAFLEHANEIKADAPAGVPRLPAVLWLGDAFALVHDWIEGSPLSSLIATPPEDWCTPGGAIRAALSVVDAIERTHESGLGHGDLKPDNIVIGQDGDVFLIDILDFTPRSDGDIQNSAYSSEGGDRFARDRFAATKIAEEIFQLSNFAPEHAAKLAGAIHDCRTKEPRLASLLPLQEAIEAVRDELEQPLPVPTRRRLVLSVRGSAVAPIEADEGFYYVRAYPVSAKGPATLHLRGAAEEIELRLDSKGQPASARRRRLPQSRIAMVARHEFYRFTGETNVVQADHTDFHDLNELLAEPTVSAKIAEVVAGRAVAAAEEAPDSAPEDEAAQEQLVEEIAEEIRAPALEVDVPRMWRSLVDIEKDLTTEGVAITDSVFDAGSGRHRVGFDLESGAFDFSRNDTVGVLRQDRKGGWRRIGELDIRRSHANAVLIDAADYRGRGSASLVEGGQRLKFLSHFETESLRRRTDAVDRILRGKGRATDLLSVFDPRARAHPTDTGHQVDEGDLEPYELNADQISAFRGLVCGLCATSKA